MLKRMTILIFIAGTVACGNPGKVENQTASNEAERAIFYGGDIITMEGDQPEYVEAVIEHDGQIIFVGSQTEAFEKYLDITERAENMAAMRELTSRGVPLSLHSDFAMAPAEPLTLAWVAINRIVAGLNYDIDFQLDHGEVWNTRVFRDLSGNYLMLTVARDPQNKRFFYNTYDDQTIRMVDLLKFDPEAKAIRILSTKSDQQIADVSGELDQQFPSGKGSFPKSLRQSAGLPVGRAQTREAQTLDSLDNRKTGL